MKTTMGNESSNMSSWSSMFSDIKSNHDAAYRVIQNGITFEEQNKNSEALEQYKEGIKLIDRALSVQITCPSNPDVTWEKAVVMIQKMKKTRGEILSRITCLQKDDENFEPNESPPSYEEAMNSPPQTYHELANALNTLTVDDVDNTHLEPEIVYLYDNVQLYFIAPSGEVSGLPPQTLKIILVESTDTNAPRAVLHFGDWVYPLIPGVSPCYRSDYGAFILPNIYAQTPGSSIGIILPPDADSEAHELLENILYGIVSKAKPQEQEFSEKVSGGIVTGASYLSQGLIFGAEKIGGLMNRNTSKYLTKSRSVDQPTEVPNNVAKGIQVAEYATTKAAYLTGFVAQQVGLATVKLGHFLAPHIQKQGTRLLTSSLHMTEEDASAKIKGVMTVAAGAVEGFSTVYCGLENSALILGKSLKDNTVKVIHHKYGHSAGEVADDTLNTMGNVYNISQNVRIVQPKYLVKKTAKAAGKAVVGYNIQNNGASTSKGYN